MLRASSEGVYGDDIWEDNLALAATDFDHQLAGAHRVGRRGIECFSSGRAQRVLEVATQMQRALRLAWRGAHHELLEAWLAGLRAGG